MLRWGGVVLLSLTALAAAAATTFIPYWIWGHYTLWAPCHASAHGPDIGCIGRIYAGDPVVVIGICLLIIVAWWAGWLLYRARVRKPAAFALTPAVIYVLFLAFYAWRLWLNRYPDS